MAKNGLKWPKFTKPYSFKILKIKCQKMGAKPENRPKSTNLGKSVGQNGPHGPHRRKWPKKWPTKWPTRSRDLNTKREKILEFKFVLNSSVHII